MLAELLRGSLEDAARRREQTPASVLETRALQQAPALDAVAALRETPGISIIAEVKRASPSRGSLATIPDPAALARTYADAGAAAISVLTEQRRFLGSLADLAAVAAAVGVPALRKDFIATPYQVFEAREAGASLVLLIVAALDQQRLRELHELIGALGMTALVEVHSADEAARAVDLGAALVGVNARDLSTFQLDTTLFGRLRDRLPAGTIAVAESAVATAADVVRYREDGADVVLVGEALVTTGDPESTVRAFIEATAPADAGRS